MPLTLQRLVARLDRLPASRFHVTVLIVAALSLFFDTLDTVVTGFAFAAFREEWHLGGLALGVTSAIGLSGYLVGSVLVGFAADRWGRKTVMMGTLVLYSLFSASRALAPGIEVFATLNFGKEVVLDRLKFSEWFAGRILRTLRGRDVGVKVRASCMGPKYLATWSWDDTLTLSLSTPTIWTRDLGADLLGLVVHEVAHHLAFHHGRKFLYELEQCAAVGLTLMLQTPEHEVRQAYASLFNQRQEAAA